MQYLPDFYPLEFTIMIRLICQLMNFHIFRFSARKIQSFAFSQPKFCHKIFNEIEISYCNVLHMPLVKFYFTLNNSFFCSSKIIDAIIILESLGKRNILGITHFFKLIKI